MKNNIVSNIALQFPFPFGPRGNYNPSPAFVWGLCPAVELYYVQKCTPPTHIQFFLYNITLNNTKVYNYFIFGRYFLVKKYTYIIWKLIEYEMRINENKS